MRLSIALVIMRFGQHFYHGVYSSHRPQVGRRAAIFRGVLPRQFNSFRIRFVPYSTSSGGSPHRRRADVGQVSDAGVGTNALLVEGDLNSGASCSVIANFSFQLVVSIAGARA